MENKTAKEQVLEVYEDAIAEFNARYEVFHIAKDEIFYSRISDEFENIEDAWQNALKNLTKPDIYKK